MSDLSVVFLAVCVGGEVSRPKGQLPPGWGLAGGAYVWGSVWLEACLRALALSLLLEALEKTFSLAD